jgi:hypothetical protein
MIPVLSHMNTYIPQYPALFILGSTVIFPFKLRSSKPSLPLGPLPKFVSTESLTQNLMCGSRNVEFEFCEGRKGSSWIASSLCSFIQNYSHTLLQKTIRCNSETQEPFAQPPPRVPNIYVK